MRRTHTGANRPTARRRRVLAAIAAASLVLLGVAATGCGSSGGGSDDSGPIKIGMVAGSSGPFAGGEAPTINGVKMAIADLNAKGGIDGRKVDLTFEDTGSEQTGAVNAYTRVLSENPVAIMDTTVSTFVLSQMPDIESSGIATLTGGASPDLTKDGPDNLFRIRTSDDIVAVAATRFALDKLGAKKLGILYVNDDYGNGWLKQIQATLSERGIKPVDVESFGDDDKDLTPQLLGLQKAGADTVIVSSNPPQHVIAMKERERLGITYDMVLSNAGVLATTLKLVNPSASEGLYGTVDSVPTENPDTKAWAARYQAKFGIPADFSSAEYYDGVMALAAAIRKVGTDPQAIIDQLRGTTGYQGLGNLYDFSKDGGQQVVIVQIHHNQPKIVARLGASS